MQFLVRLSSASTSTPGEGEGEKQWVRRTQLRLTAAPWQEELAGALAEQSMALQNNLIHEPIPGEH